MTTAGLHKLVLGVDYIDGTSGSLTDYGSNSLRVICRVNRLVVDGTSGMVAQGTVLLPEHPLRRAIVGTDGVVKPRTISAALEANRRVREPNDRPLNSIDSASFAVGLGTGTGSPMHRHDATCTPRQTTRSAGALQAVRLNSGTRGIRVEATWRGPHATCAGSDAVGSATHLTDDRWLPVCAPWTSRSAEAGVLL